MKAYLPNTNNPAIIPRKSGCGVKFQIFLPQRKPARLSDEKAGISKSKLKVGTRRPEENKL